MTVGRASLGLVLGGVVLAMLGLSFAAVPLYRVFCAVTGYGGTPRIGGERAPGENGRAVTVRFNADTAPDMPWRFAPEQAEITLPLGSDQIAFYRARNVSTGDVTGIALYNVTPEKAARYFHKTACFCFNRQTLSPGQEMQFPLSFWVDPALATDPAVSDVHVITLSYTFFRTLDDARRAGALAHAGPHVGAAPAPDPGS